MESCMDGIDSRRGEVEADLQYVARALEKTPVRAWLFPMAMSTNKYPFHCLTIDQTFSFLNNCSNLKDSHLWGRDLFSSIYLLF